MQNLKGTNLSAYLQLHFIVLVWGFTAILGKLITVPSVEVVFYRTLIGVVGLFLLLKLKGLSSGVSKLDAWKLLGTGVIIGVHWITFFLAAQVSNISICLAGIATTSLWTSFLDPLISKKKIKWYEPILGITSALGIVLVFNSAYDQWLGLFIAIISAMLAATFTVVNSKLVASRNHYVISLYEMIGACAVTIVCMLIFGLIGQDIQLGLTQMDFIYLLILGGVCTVFAYSIGVKIMKRLTPFSVNLTINLEPVYGILLAVLMFKEEEEMGVNFYLGTGLIICSVLFYPIITKFIEKSNTPTFRNEA
ncbi:MAG: DMT family transporter [Reichenbachiella sp.]